MLPFLHDLPLSGFAFMAGCMRLPLLKASLKCKTLDSARATSMLWGSVH